MSRTYEYSHIPVMVAEVVELLAGVPPGVVLDGTAGGGGHARAVLDAAAQVSVLALDQDPDAVAASTAALAGYGGRARVVKARFDAASRVAGAAGASRLSGALFDLGVSSPQLDRPERGFSYWSDAPLDMRMDTSAPAGAGEVVNGWAQADLASLFAGHGETRFARRIAAAVVAARPIHTTAQLAEVVRAAIPAAARRHGGHPARRVFQAVRVAVNDELRILPGALDDVIDMLAPGGRLVVLSYHSGEDRVVKDRFARAATGDCTCPTALPCVCGAVPVARLLNRGARKPSPSEVAANPRAGSARLRAIEALDRPTQVHR